MGILKKYILCVLACIIFGILPSAAAEEETGVSPTEKYIKLDIDDSFMLTASDPVATNTYLPGSPKYKQMFEEYGVQQAFDGDIYTVYIPQQNAERKYIQIGLPKDKNYVVKRVGIIMQVVKPVEFTNGLEIYGGHKSMNGALKNATFLSKIEGIEKSDGTEYFFDINENNENYNYIMILAQKINSGQYVSMHLGEVSLYIENPDYDEVLASVPDGEAVSGLELLPVERVGDMLSGGFIYDGSTPVKSAGIKLSNGIYKVGELPKLRGEVTVKYSAMTEDEALTGENAIYN